MKYICIFLLFNTLLLLGQDEFNYFNKIIIEDSIALDAVGLEVLEDNFLLTGTFNSLNNYRAIYLKKMNFNGETLWTKILDDTTEGNISAMASGTSFVKDAKNPHHFLAMYGKYQNESNTDLGVALIKFDIEGNILWEKLHGDQNRQAPYDLINTNDGGYLISGWEQVSSNFTQGYVLKLDSLGNEQWHKNYTTSEAGHSSVGFADQTIDGGFLFSGYTYHPQTDADMYIVKTDALGNILWDKNEGSIYHDLACQLYELNNGDFFLSSAIWYEGDRQKYFAKLDNNGVKIWEKYFLIPNIGIIAPKMHLTNDGGVLGFTRIRGANNLPLLIRFTSRGDTLWTKPITPDPNNDVYVRDMEATPDGGYIIAGFNYTHTPQYGWIAKIDSLGNTCWSSLDCDSTVVFTNIPQIPTRNPYEVQVAPNPVRDRATISYQLPLDGRLQLYDLQGRWIREWWLPAAVESMPMELGELESGLYLYRVRIEGREVSSGKLIVEK